MTWETHRYDLVIREYHLDSFGHVNNAVYLQLLEEARWDFITRRGYGYDRVHQLGIGPTILEITLQFRKELRLRQKIVIESTMVSYPGKVGELRQEIKNENEDIHCVALFKIGLFDMRQRKLISPTPEWLHAVGAAPSSP